MTAFVTDASRADVRNLLQHAGDLLERNKKLDALRTENVLDSFQIGTDQIRTEASRYLEPYRLAIVGDFKVGKSSLINALLGQKNLVAEGVAPTTGAVTELHWGDAPSGEVHDRTGKVIFSGDPEIAARYADQRKPEGMQCSGQGLRVILKRPADVLRNLIIIDTPGLGANEHDDSVTLGALHIADAAVLVLGAGKAGGDAPVQMAERLRSSGKQVTLVITRADLDAPSYGKTSAAEMAEVFHEVIDGPPIIFSSKMVQAALDAAVASVESRDEDKAREAREELQRWGYEALSSRILEEHLSATGTSGAARARASLGELRKRCKTLSVSAAREQDVAGKQVEILTEALDETERVVAEVLDPKVPYLEDRIEDIVDQYLGKLLDSVREAVEVFVDSRMDSGVTEGAKALWAKFSDEYAEERSRDLQRSFRQLCPQELFDTTGQDIERGVTRLLKAEWRATVRELGTLPLGPGVAVDDLTKKIDEHLTKVLASIAADLAAFIGLFFASGGIAGVVELVGALALTRSQMSKADARAALIKRTAGLQIRNQRAALRNQLAQHYRTLNEHVHGMVVAKTRASSGEHTLRREAARAARDQWREAVRDLSVVLEAIADIEQGGL